MRISADSDSPYYAPSAVFSGTARVTWNGIELLPVVELDTSAGWVDVLAMTDTGECAPPGRHRLHGDVQVHGWAPDTEDDARRYNAPP